MVNVRYRHVLVSCHDSKDGETPTLVEVTEEPNCWAVWFDSFDTGEVLLRAFRYQRDQAIEFATRLTLERATAMANARVEEERRSQ